MDASTHILLSGALSFGVPLAFAVLELFALRRGGGRGGGGGRRVPTPPRPDPRPAPAGEPPAAARRPLPDCLVPKPLPVADRRRVREPEPV